MPFRRRYRRRFPRRRRRRFYRGRRRRFRRGRVSRRFMIGARRRRSYRIPRRIWPKMLVTELTWVQAYNLQTTNLGPFASHTIRANSVYDPQWAVGGHSPAGFDRLAAEYTTYTVLGAKLGLRVTVANNTSDDQQNFVGLGLVTAAQRTVYRNNPLNQRLEQPTTKWRTVGNATSGFNVVNIRSFYKARKFWRTKTLTDNDQEAIVSDNPVNEALFVPWVEQFGTGGGVTDWQLVVRVKYLGLP